MAEAVRVANRSIIGILPRSCGESAQSGREAATIMSSKSDDQASVTEKRPHYHGHRARLRQRFLEAGSEAVSGCEP